MRKRKTTEPWHISRSVPIVFILAVIMQTSAIIWGAAKLDTRVQSIEDWIKNNSQTQVNLARHEQAIQALDVRLSRVELRK